MQRCMGCMREFGKEYDICPHCGYIVGTPVSSKTYLEPGTILQNRYTLGRVLGQGGFGITYIAWDNKIGREVAIKEYMPHAFASRITGEKDVSCYSEEAQRQFDIGLEKTRRETHALAQFNALESVVKVFDCIEENQTAYIIMELLRGKTVKEILTERKKLTFAQTMRIMTPVLQTLDAMHKVGMIHRDIAPDNIFVCDDGKIKLLDFGAARVVSGADDKSLSVMLKHGYAPVEQYSSKGKQGAYTDVYAASATMYKMLTGETPPDSVSREKDGSDLRALAHTDTPPKAQAILLRGLSIRAAERIQSAKELLDRLQAELPERIDGIDPTEFLKEQKKRKIKKLLPILLGAAAVLGAIILIVILLPGTEKPPVEVTTEAAEVIEPITGAEETTASQIEETTSLLSESNTQDDSGWIEAYRSFLLDLCKNTKADETPTFSISFGIPAKPAFDLCYIDDDDIPELHLLTSDYDAADEDSAGGDNHIIVSFDGKETHVFKIYAGHPAHGSLEYSEKSGTIVSFFMHQGAYETTVYHLNDGIVREVWKGGFSGLDEVTYYSMDQEISKDAYYELDRQYVPTDTTPFLLGVQGDALFQGMPLSALNVETYFSALVSPESILRLHPYDSNIMTLTGTVTDMGAEFLPEGSEPAPTENLSLVLDTPLVVSIQSRKDPVLVPFVRLEYASMYRDQIGKRITVKGNLSGYEEEDTLFFNEVHEE